MCKAMEEIMEDRIVEREQKAREEAKAEEKKEDILECLKRYGEISEKLKRRIFAESDLAVLKYWFQVALNVKSIEDFQNAMQ